MAPGLRFMMVLLVACSPLVGAEGARPATREERSLLQDALIRTADDMRRWAYTEHRIVRRENGAVRSEQLVRFDPSRPYAEQWTPVRIDGREPTERERERFRRRGERTDRDRPPPRFSFRGDRPRPALGEVIDLEKTRVDAESATHWVFEVPLREQDNDRFPPEKFQVFVRVRKEGARLESIAVTLRDSFRAKLLVKVKSGEGTIEFAEVDPAHPPTMVAVTGDASASLLFVPVGGSVDLKRTDLRRVKPYDERFEVQIGDLKAIDF